MMEKVKPAVTNNLILTAGPCIDYREAEYCADAAKNGWNNHHSDYIKKFEGLFKSYIGMEHGFVTSSCTGALHLALKAKGIGPGDEVIVPETTWIATAAAVVYVGAKPVFADIEADTWVLDPHNIEKLINKNTKAIIPVHLYGQPVDMDPVNELARKHGLFVLEDAAPSIGSIYKGKKTGSLGDASAVSFQGAKAVVTGEGGFLLTKDEELKKRAWFFNDHCRDPERTLFNIDIGYKYKMSNIQAALGLAQMEKIEEIVAQKRQIFAWYHERLADIEEIKLNVEKPDTRNIYWMTSLILEPQVKFSRDEFIVKLKERKIDSRPMFHPISSFPMFDNADNPVAYSVPLRGINLPSGHERTEEEIDYICSHIRNLLDKGAGKTFALQPQGVLALRDRAENKLAELKRQPTKFEIQGGYLESISNADVDSAESVALLAQWREASQDAFPSQFKVTQEGTKKWLENALLKIPDRLLFWVCDLEGNKLGHVGLFRFDYKNKFCELDNIVRGKEGSPGLMQAACQFLLDFCKELELQDVYLRVFADNDKAIKLYEKLGFEEIQRTPLRSIRQQESVQWIDITKSPYEQAEKYFVTMKHGG